LTVFDTYSVIKESPKVKIIIKGNDTIGEDRLYVDYWAKRMLNPKTNLTLYELHGECIAKDIDLINWADGS
jgi:hypothetical protein